MSGVDDLRAENERLREEWRKADDGWIAANAEIERLRRLAEAHWDELGRARAQTACLREASDASIDALATTVERWRRFSEALTRDAAVEAAYKVKQRGGSTHAMIAAAVEAAKKEAGLK